MGCTKLWSKHDIHKKAGQLFNMRKPVPRHLQMLLSCYHFLQVNFHMEKTFLISTAISRLHALTNLLMVNLTDSLPYQWQRHTHTYIRTHACTHARTHTHAQSHAHTGTTTDIPISGHTIITEQTSYHLTCLEFQPYIDFTVTILFQFTLILIRLTWCATST